MEVPNRNCGRPLMKNQPAPYPYRSSLREGTVDFRTQVFFFLFTLPRDHLTETIVGVSGTLISISRY